jgi:hypothetical protein
MSTRIAGTPRREDCGRRDGHVCQKGEACHPIMLPKLRELASRLKKEAPHA